MNTNDAADGIGHEGARAALLAFALRLPEAFEDHPWGETVVKVRKKVFVFLGHAESFGLSVKLPQSAFEALLLPFTEPTGYGLGKSGWVTARFERDAAIPLTLLREWIEESYRAVAPKTRVKGLEASIALRRQHDTSAPSEGPARRRKA